MGFCISIISRETLVVVKKRKLRLGYEVFSTFFSLLLRDAFASGAAVFSVINLKLYCA